MKLAVSMSETDYKLTVSLLNGYNEVMSSGEIDLPLETTVSKAEVSEDGTTLTITFRNGSVISFGVSELAKGLITKEEADRTYAPKTPINEAYKAVRVVHGRNANKTEPIEIPASMGNWANNIASYSNVTSYGDHDNGGAIVTTTPAKPYQAANKKYVDDGFVKKLSAAENAAGMNVYTNTISEDGTSVDVARKLYWNDGGNEPTVAYNGGMPQYANGYIPVRTPTEAQPYAAANKKYVDEEITKVEALLGALIKSVEVEGHQNGWSVPEGVLPNFYFPSTEVEYTTGDYDSSETATTHINTLYFYNENMELLGSEAAISDTYYGMPSGTTHIGNDFSDIMGELDPPFNYMAATPCKLTFMVKVGA